MRILILSSEFPPGPGGIGTHAFHIARELGRNGNTIMVITPQDYATEDEINAFNQVLPFELIRLKHHPMIIMEALNRISAVNKTIKTWKPDIVMTTGGRSSWIMAFTAWMHQVKWVAVGHGTEFGRPLSLEKRLSRWAFNQADGVICVSYYTSKVMHTLGITPKNETVIHNGADSELFANCDERNKFKTLREFGINKQAKVLLTVGNVTRRKGQEVVIQALPLIHQKYPETEYLLAGLPTEKERLQQLAQNLGIQERVHFLGRVPNEQLRELYQACDVFLMTSQQLADGDFEGFGIGVIEAALCGKPAIVSKGAGLEEAVLDAETGLCVAEGDPKQTADAVIKLFDKPELLKQLGEAAQERASGEYTWQHAGKMYQTFLEAIFRSRQVNA